MLEQGLDNLLHHSSGEVARVHLLGERVHPHQPAVHGFGLIGVDLGVSHVVMALVDSWLAKEDVLLAGVVILHDILHAVEPHHLDGAGAVGEQSVEATPRALALSGERDKSPTQLYIWHLALHLADFVDGRAVNISEREIIEHVIERMNVELFPQQIGPLRSHSWQVFYVGLSKPFHLYIKQLLTIYKPYICLMSSRAKNISMGVVILILVTSPSTRVTLCPALSTTLASSVKSGDSSTS